MKKKKFTEPESLARFTTQEIKTRNSATWVLMDAEKTLPCYYPTLFWCARLKLKPATTQYHWMHGIKSFYEYYLETHQVSFDDFLQDTNCRIDMQLLEELHTYYDWLVARKTKKHSAAYTYRKFFAVVSFFEYLIGRYFKQSDPKSIDFIEDLREFYSEKSKRNKIVVNHLMFHGLTGKINVANTLITDKEFSDFLDSCGDRVAMLKAELNLAP